jgi:hypothetical protein
MQQVWLVKLPPSALLGLLQSRPGKRCGSVSGDFGRFTLGGNTYELLDRSAETMALITPDGKGLRAIDRVADAVSLDPHLAMLRLSRLHERKRAPIRLDVGTNAATAMPSTGDLGLQAAKAPPNVSSLSDEKLKQELIEYFYQAAGMPLRLTEFKRLRQPRARLLEILGKIAIYNESGRWRHHWTLKAEYC